MLDEEVIKKLSKEIGVDIQEVIEVHMKMNNCDVEKITAILIALKNTSAAILLTLVCSSEKKGLEENLIVAFYDETKEEVLKTFRKSGAQCSAIIEEMMANRPVHLKA